MNLANAACIEDLRRMAHRRLPAMLSGFVDSGASSEATLAANSRDFERWTLNLRVLVDISSRSLATHFLGADRPMPFMLAPLGLTGMLWPRGEEAAARAAAAAGIPYCLSTASICSLEEVVAAAGPGTVCYQLYVMTDRALTERMVERAEAAGVDTLFLTVDTIVGGIREADIRSGFRTADRPSPKAALDILRHPGWALGMLRESRRPRLGNLSEWGEFSGLMAQAAALVRQLDPTLSWNDLRWLRDRWKGRLVIKGILSVEDAQRAVDAGAEAIVVSNHGGRQLDGARSAISVLPEIAAAVGGRAEILFDSGIRRGAQIVKALALGADACMLGRAFVYGLSAAGEAGVTKAIDLMRNEMDITLALMGVTSIAELKGNGRVLVRDESAPRQ
jgi:isopentenyl diphosphate isomerase/L-lactate dehydrogenase-like FMN-dependent dehydrogenase